MRRLTEWPVAGQRTQPMCRTACVWTSGRCNSVPLKRRRGGAKPSLSIGPGSGNRNLEGVAQQVGQGLTDQRIIVHQQQGRPRMRGRRYFGDVAHAVAAFGR